MQPHSLPSLLLALLIGTAPALAQTPEPTDPQPDSSETPRQAQETEAPVAAPGAPQLPPDDYEASEQISEDLSVSFPIDI